MSKDQIRALMERVSEWPKQAQEELFRTMIEIETRHGRIYHVDDDERTALEQSEDDVRAGRLASERQVKEMFGRFLDPTTEAL